MSYMICRMQKYKKSDIKGAEIHDFRLTQNSKNLDINKGLSHLNFDLHNENTKVNYLSKWKKIISDYRTDQKTIRKDAVCMNQFLVTSDKAFFENMDYDEMKKFFQESYDVLSERYGKENIISAIVHLDETTPHMHLSLVPIKGGTLSSKAIFDRQELCWLQDTIWERVGEARGLRRGEKRTDKVKNIPMMEFKTQTIEKLDKEIEFKSKKLKASKKIFETIEGLENIETSKLPFGSSLMINSEDYSKLLNQAIHGFKSSLDAMGMVEENGVLKSKLERLEKKLANIEAEWRKKFDELEKQNKQINFDLKKELITKENTIGELEEKASTMDRVYYLMSLNPKIRAELVKTSDEDNKRILLERDKKTKKNEIER